MGLVPGRFCDLKSLKVISESGHSGEFDASNREVDTDDYFPWPDDTLQDGCVIHRQFGVTRRK